MKRRLILFGFAAFALGGCVNRHGVSLKYYSECKEYYDLQGYYHKECGKDDIITYKGAAQNVKKIFVKEKKDPRIIEGDPAF